MKQFLLKTPLFAWAYRQGGIDSFPLAQKDVLETMADDLAKKAEALSQEKLAKLLSVIDPNKIVKLDSRNGVVFIGEERPDEGKLAALKAEAEYFEKSDLWHILHETPKALAHKAMFTDDGVLENQLLKGRAILYGLDTQSRILDVFKSYKPK